MIRTALSPQVVLEAIERLDPMPMSVNRLLELANAPDGGLNEVAEVVRFDPILSADVLRRSNSPIYGARQTILDVPHAVSRLGASEVLNMAMMRTMHGRMASALPQYGFNSNELWHHSLSAAIAAEELARFSRQPGLANASTAALIHDVGKLVIANIVPASTMMRLAEESRQSRRPLYELEHEAFGVHHGDVGGTVARSWGFPLAVQVAIIGHHPPHNSDDALSLAVRAANRIAHEVGAYREDPNRSITEGTMKVIVALGLGARDVGPLFDRTIDALDSVLSAYV